MGTKETFRYTAVYIDFKGSTETKITKYIQAFYIAHTDIHGIKIKPN